MLRTITLAVASVAMLGLVACSDNGSAEKAGENADSAIEEATQGHENLGDGPLEQAGESVDGATGRTNNDPADAASDATDGRSSTSP